jgi:hypothetical protein
MPERIVVLRWWVAQPEPLDQLIVGAHGVRVLGADRHDVMSGSSTLIGHLDYPLRRPGMPVEWATIALALTPSCYISYRVL